ncbi:hypothetical protein Misp05_02970 [Micromonospora sp. NBRC 107095]|nr:hypothetical protein Misp05_02970 [Micromonospora sp. NBRC 107095]
MQLQRRVQNSEGTCTEAHDRRADSRPPASRVSQLRLWNEAATKKPLPPAGAVQLPDLIPGQAGTQCLAHGDHAVLPGRYLAKKLIRTHAHTLSTHPAHAKPLWTTPKPLWITPPPAR